MADDTLMEERQELMVSGEEHFRKAAHFLKPSATSAAASPNPSAAATCKGGFPVKLKIFSWACKWKWKTWVSQMRSSHESTWKKAGIFDAIISSTYCIPRCEDLILGLSEKWSPTTNTFVFPWAEATITLEDMMVLGAFSVLGEPVFIPPSPGDEYKVNKLLEARLDICNSPARRACLSRWIKKFMGSGSEIEHEAFLAYWLSKFVFPFLTRAICKSVLSIAVHLAKGTRIALAPAVLAFIYRTLTLLREGKSMSVKRKRKTEQTFVVSAPLAFVQVWAWERLPLLRPKPKRVGGDEPRLARWAGKARLSYTAIVPAGGEDSGWRWRPYDGVYMDIERWEVVESEELESFVRCVRVSKLVGLEKGCLEQYLPHRVARQFGMDQDLPARVAARDEVDRDIAWSDYIRPVGDAKVYVPSRSYQPCVTRRYFEWWTKFKGEDLGIAPDVSEQVRDEMDVDVEAVSMQSEDAMDVYDHVPLRVFMRRRTRCVNKENSAFGGKDLEDEMDIYGNVPLRVFLRRHTSCVNKVRTAYGGKGRFKRSKRRYLQLFRRQRDVGFVSVPQRDARRHSAVIDSDSENSEKSSKISEKSCESLEKSFEKSSEQLMPVPMEVSDSGRSCEIEGQHEGEDCLVSEESCENSERFMPAPVEISDSGRACEIEGKHEAQGEKSLFSEKSSKSSEKSSGKNIMTTPAEASDFGRGCEIEGKHEAQGKNCLFSGAINENIGQLSQATVDKAEEMIGSENDSKNSKKNSKISEKSSKCSEKLMPAPTKASNSSSKCWESSEKLMPAPVEGENCLFPGAKSNENIVVQLSEARINGGAEEKIDWGGFGERVRNIDEILKLISAGNLLIKYKLKHQ